MDVIKTLKPGQNGTQRLIERYGADLLNGRYRDDPTQGMRYTTVELIVPRKPLLKFASSPRPDTPAAPLHLCIHYREKALQQQIRQAGGHWQPTLKTWLLDKERMMRLGLEDRLELP